MATINDIAKMAGVSAATVSHVVNKTRYVSPKLVKKVEEAIDALEYPPNFVVKKKKTKAAEVDMEYVLFLAEDIHNPFHAEVERVVQKNMENAGYPLVSLSYGENGRKLDLYSQLLLAPESAVGIVAFPGAQEAHLLELLREAEAPVVLVGKKAEAYQADTVLSDNYGGAYRATNHLIKSGHEYIAIVSGGRGTEVDMERINGYKAALEDNGIALSPEYVISGLDNEKEIFQTLVSMNALENPPTAVFATNYRMVISILRFIGVNNIECPKDLSIISFNDFEWAELHNPSITTVAQDTKSIGEEVARLLLERMRERRLKGGGDSEESGGADFKEIVVPTELRIRASTSGIGRGPFGEKAASMEVLQLSESEKRLVRVGKYTAAVSFHYTGKAWAQLHEQGIKDEFNSLGISLLAVTDAHFNPTMQSKQLESLLTMEPDILISIPVDNEETSEAYKKIARSETKLVLITNVPNGLGVEDYVTCVSVNEHSHGRSAGRGLGEYMHRHNLRNVGIVRHGAVFYATNQRDDAAEQILLEEYPELTVCGKTFFEREEEAYQKTIELMKMNPEIQGIYVSWEGPAAQVVAALAEIGRTDVVVSTADLEYVLALNMAKGGAVKAISAQRPYEQGRAMALAAANALIGKKVPSFIGVEPIYVTQENLLKTWETVYKEAPPIQLANILKSPNVMEKE
ncbi:LacI family DNA-binding transcriptional regulator [Anaerotalea alkaliphila]|uniref:Substrate-binding domain-containing protein n=1 Tax=Anaerotalea alkaliphila TaxID=2662126 RepID=A0A7X5HXX4_9FIRM|nr:LacI family DNA-binding transcriptional regulator [Anaerotalea alkaliphila]NDL68655.1 substrate-binding domain-containing protein [Anaerotalea alkaliphila]